MLIWGVAIPQDGDFTKMGTVVKGNIKVAEADPGAVYANTYGFTKAVYHRYLGKDYGKNVFGAPVPVFLYGSPQKVQEEVEQANREAQAKYEQLCREYLFQQEASLRSIYGGDKNHAKEVLLEVLSTDCIPQENLESWKAGVRSWLAITDEEIERGKVGTVLAQEYVDQAERALSRSDYDEAMKLIDHAGSLDPDRPEYETLMTKTQAGKAPTLVDRAGEAYRALLYFRAQTLLRDAYEIDPNNEMIPLLNRGILKKRKSPVLAAAFSLLPGAGQFYNHQTWKGVFFSATYIGFAAAFVSARMKMESKWDSYLAATDPDEATSYYDQAKSAYETSWIFLACAAGVTAWSMSDAYRGTVKYNDRHFLNDWDVGLSLMPSSEVEGVLVGLRLKW